MRIKLFIISILMLLSFSGAASAQTVVSIQDASAQHGKTATVPIMIINVTSVGAVTINLTYNKDVVQVALVTAADFGGTTVSNIDNTIGLTRISAFSAGGLSNNVTLANVTLRAVGSAGQSSPLNLSIDTLADTNEEDIPATLSNGTFYITGVPVSAPAVTPLGLIILSSLLGLAAIGKIRSGKKGNRR